MFTGYLSARNANSFDFQYIFLINQERRTKHLLTLDFETLRRRILKIIYKAGRIDAKHKKKILKTK